MDNAHERFDGSLPARCPINPIIFPLSIVRLSPRQFDHTFVKYENSIIFIPPYGLFHSYTANTKKCTFA